MSDMPDGIAPEKEDEVYNPTGERIISCIFNRGTTSCGIAIYSDPTDSLTFDSLPVSVDGIEEMYFNLKQVS